MFTSIIASVAMIGATAYASTTGTAYVVNMCSYDVHLCNVPSAGGGYEQTEEILQSGQSWSQQWTQLSNGNGWSIKLSKDSSMSNILQYEYTWQNEGTIWYDLSCVNGNPWDGNWEISSSTSNCNPKQQAYRYATDDAYGEQSCPGDASITVTLCSGEATDNGTYGNAGSESSSAAAPSSSAVAPSYSAQAPAPATPAEAAPAETPAAVTYGYNWNNADVSQTLSAVVQPTTFATQVSAIAVGADGKVVNVVETVYVTDTVTAYAAKPKRHEHHPHHRHN